MASPDELHIEVRQVEQAGDALPYDGARQAIEELGFTAVTSQLEEVLRSLNTQIEETDRASAVARRVVAAIESSVLPPLGSLCDTTQSDLLRAGSGYYEVSGANLSHANTQLKNRVSKIETAVEMVGRLLDFLSPGSDSHRSDAISDVNDAISAKDKANGKLSDYRHST